MATKEFCCAGGAMPEEVGSCRGDSTPPLHEMVVLSPYIKHLNANRALVAIHCLLLAYYFRHRLIWSPVHENEAFGFWVIAVICELFLAVLWFCGQTTRLFAVERQAHPERLQSRYGQVGALSKLPAVDVFVTTADPRKEPPLITMNTVLSVLAADYPTDRAACYLSDDGGALITFWSLVETSKFAKKWIPFCKRFNVERRNPSSYFSWAFQLPDSNFNDWTAMKEEYEQFANRINLVADSGEVPDDVLSSMDGYQKWPAESSRKHPGIVQVLLDHHSRDVEGNVLPCLIYVSREKHPDRKHHNKAGALNALTRVSGLLTNANFILNLDCDVFISDPKAIQQAMCFFMDPSFASELSFVQFPQAFEEVDKDDRYASRMKSTYDIIAKSVDGIQGSFDFGAGCMHSRVALYQYENDTHIKSLSKEILPEEVFGRSGQLFSSAVHVLECQIGRSAHEVAIMPPEVLDDVIRCDYEDGTFWGKKIGWIYGSACEDILTGLVHHSRGWRSVYCSPLRSAFQGSAPPSGTDALVWRKRLSCGVTEILFSKYSPFRGGQRGLKFLQRIGYIIVCGRPSKCTAIFIYATLPVLCLVNGKSIFPKMSDPAMFRFILVFVSLYLNQYMENVWMGSGLRGWWNNERMSMLLCVSSWLLGAYEAYVRFVSGTDSVFILTPKYIDSNQNHQGKGTSFVFNSSGLFVPPTVLIILNVLGVAEGMRRIIRGGIQAVDVDLAHLFCACWVLACLGPICHGLLRMGRKGGMPMRVVLKACAYVAAMLWIARLLCN
eukprot:c23239_g1_i1 orf=383-2719(-)